MKHFNKSSSFSKRDSGRSTPSRRDFGRANTNPSRPAGRYDRRDDRSERPKTFELHEVICSKCGIKCEVPFKPTNNKPVYCRECFKQNNPSESAKTHYRFDSREKTDDRFEEKSKPAERYQSRERSSSVSEELERINWKLDKIIRALKID